MRASWSEAPRWRCGLAAILAASIIAFLPGALGAGLLSDDHALLGVAARSDHPILAPLERHHFTLPLHLLFAALARGWVTERIWHLLAVGVHELNAVLLLVLARRGLALDRRVALVAAALFAASPAGSEAVFWLSATGYVFVAPFVLAGAALALGARPSARAAFVLAAVQAVALVAHDTGALFLPVAFVLMTAAEPRQARRHVVVLAPAAAVWVALLAAKRASGWVVAAYGRMNDLAYALRSLAVGPVTILFPQGEKPFYSSGRGIALGVAILGLLLLGAWRSRGARAALAGYVVVALPAALFATPQSRYDYLPGAFVALALAATLVELVPSHRLQRVLAAALVSVALLWTIQRGAWFRGAASEALSVKTQIEALPQTGGKPLVIVNLPDRYGPRRTIFRPYVWRNGWDTGIARPFVPVNVPGASFVWEEAEGIPLVARGSVRARFPRAAIYEVVEDEPSFRIIPFVE